jgi:hypothetical protein
MFHPEFRLDWRPIFDEIKQQRFTSDPAFQVPLIVGRKSIVSLYKMVSVARQFYAPESWNVIFQELLPYFNPLRPEMCMSVVNTLCHFVPANVVVPLDTETHIVHKLPS